MLAKQTGSVKWVNNSFQVCFVTSIVGRSMPVGTGWGVGSRGACEPLVNQKFFVKIVKIEPLLVESC